MDLNFRPVEAEDMSRLRPFYGLRPNRTVTAYSWTLFMERLLQGRMCSQRRQGSFMAYGKRWHTFKRHASLQGRRSSIFLLFRW